MQRLNRLLSNYLGDCPLLNVCHDAGEFAVRSTQLAVCTEYAVQSIYAVQYPTPHSLPHVMFSLCSFAACNVGINYSTLTDSYNTRRKLGKWIPA